MPARWIDFAAIKRQVPIRDVLARYGFLDGLVEKKPGIVVGACPIHGGTGKASFHVDTSKNIWNCFSVCKGGGNVLDFVMKVENCSIREAGEKLAEWFGLSFDRNTVTQESAKVSEKTETSTAAVAHDEQRVEVINPPLERPLRNLNDKHPYLTERGLAHDTITHFGIGFCSVGLMRGRIAIPIHNENEDIVAYAGRAINEAQATDEGKYKLPRGFSKSHVLYNLNRAKEHARVSGLIVVEGFFGAMRVHEAGFPNVAALMGCSMSEEQERLLVAHTDRVALMFDGDDAGRACSHDCLDRMKTQMYVKEVRVGDGEAPDTLSAERIRELLS